MPPTETYTQSRVRVNQDGAFLLRELLKREEVRVLGLRRELAEARIQTGVEGYNQLLARIRRVGAEVSRTIDDMAWE